MIRRILLVVFLFLVATPSRSMYTYDLITGNSARMSAVGENTALVVAGPYIYAGYVDGDLNAVVAQRSIGGGSWTHQILGADVLDDAHNAVSIGVDPQGHIHAVWDIHNSQHVNYKRSTEPHNLASMEPYAAGGAQPSSASYARFYNAGAEFYMLIRDGVSGNGDEWIKRWSSGSWVDLAVPLIQGSTLEPPDNAYVGHSIGTDNGNLHLIWTHRVGFYNCGAYYARYDVASGTWRDADGNVYALPITRLTALSITDPGDCTLSNNGLGLVVVAGSPRVVFARQTGGFSEAFYAQHNGSAWEVSQVSRVRATRLRACPAGPQDGPFRPCDFELQGPTILQTGEVSRIFYARSVAPSNETWQRPAAILYESGTSTGSSFTTVEIRRGTEALAGEVVRESTGRQMFLLQELVNESGPLYLVDATEVAAPPPSAALSITLPAGGAPYVDVPDADLWSSPAFTVSAWVKPRQIAASMGIIDKGGDAASREFRVLLWGNAPPFVYEGSRVQILLGGVAGWACMWHPQVQILPGEWTHLAVTYDGALIKAYRNGEAVAQVECSAQLGNRGSPVVIGANRSAAGIPERFFVGSMELEYYRAALTEQQVKKLFQVANR